MYVNIACGSSYITSPDWVNIDYASCDPSVLKANLLDRLPFDDGVVDVIYCSHFVEHIPRDKISDFLSECNRILVEGGRIRLVMPDLQEMCREYLERRKNGEHEMADFVVLEMLDQCVRTFPSGELGVFYEHLRNKPDEKEMKKYVFERTGENIESPNIKISSARPNLSLLRRLRDMLFHKYSKVVAQLLPTAFRRQNVSFASVGEKHTWIYDFHTISKLLVDRGFVDCKKMHFNSTEITNFPLDPLDMNESGQARKGAESMYIEAVKA